MFFIGFIKCIQIPFLFKLNETVSFKNVNNGFNTNFSFYLETSGGQNSNVYLNHVNTFNTRVN
jgi:hypothetical protein